MSKKLTREQAIEKLWRMGNLEYQLRGVQKEMRNAVYNSKGKKTVFLCSRRLGKTYVMLLVAVEYCLRNENTVVKMLFPKKKDAKSVSRKQMKDILRDCPSDLTPVWKESDNVYTFGNGSEIQMAGTDGGSAESVRGSACHLALLDEAGFQDYREFSYIIKSIIMPTLVTTGGKMILASTPSKEPDHPFMTDFVMPARMDGSIIEYDVYSNPMISPEVLEEFKEEYPGGEEDPDFQREFLLKCDVIGDDFVVPEFTHDVQKDIIMPWKRPIFYNGYVSGDPAATDLTHILFGYIDYLNGKLIIDDELVLGGDVGDAITTQQIADGIRRKESFIFKNNFSGEVQTPMLRIMDNNNKILLNDLQTEHGLYFIGTKKDGKDGYLNKLRMYIRQGKIVINPRCKQLIYQLSTTRWKITMNGNRNGFQRSKGDRNNKMYPHHGDGVDALIYLVRNIDFNMNPYPDTYFHDHNPDIHYGENSLAKGNSSKIKDLMGAIIGKKIK